MEIRRRIRSSGPITFDEFMTVALHWPDGGYYATRVTLGPSGDFYTAPLTHPVFGALVARQIAEMWRACGSPDRWRIVEMGAGTGRLAADILSAVEREHPRLALALRYLAIDASAAPGTVPGMDWARSTASPVRGLNGVVLANEMLDALPVHRVTVRDGQLRELRVGVGEGDGFVDVIGEPAPGVAERLDRLGVRLTEGHVAEVCLETDRWLGEIGVSMASGYLLLIDYGHDAEAYYDVSRSRGTLRTYYRHTLGMDPYRHVGRQDISVHVDFTSVRNAAHDAGFRDAGVVTQAEFLRNLGFDAYRTAVAAREDVQQGERAADLRAADLRAANLRAMDTLVDPGGMGRFRVLAFAKGVPVVEMSGFAGGPALEVVDAPLATASHMPLSSAVRESPQMSTWDELLR